MDFSTVKNITIPEGTVTQIKDSNNTILWSGPYWRTIWTGNMKTYSNADRSNLVCNTIQAEEYKFRITYTYSYETDTSVFQKFIINNVESFAATLSSPIEITADLTKIQSNVLTILGVGRQVGSSTKQWAKLSMLGRDEYSIYLSTQGYSSSYGSMPWINITKIEQFV